MKIIADIAERYSVLKNIEEVGKTVNEDGSTLDAYLELASELYEKPRKKITFEERNHVIKIVRHSLEQAVFNETIRSAQQAAAGKPFPWRPV